MRDQEHRIDRALENAAKRSNSERDCQRILNETIHMRTKMAKLEADYMKRLNKVLSAQKLTRALVADQSFGRNHFRRMMEKRERHPQNKR